MYIEAQRKKLIKLKFALSAKNKLPPHSPQSPWGIPHAIDTDLEPNQFKPT